MSQRAVFYREKAFEIALIAIALLYVPIGFAQPLLSDDLKETAAQLITRGAPLVYGLGVLFACGWLLCSDLWSQEQKILLSPQAGTVLITSVRFWLSLSSVEPLLSLIIRLTIGIAITTGLYYIARTRLSHYKNIWTMDRVVVMIASSFGDSNLNP